MCYAEGSIDQAVNACPMCKVFPHQRCPHTREVCRNRTNHPRIDVLFLKNAEVDSFNGCGYCKWARTNPPPKSAGYNNPGWPGCCRPPAPSEHRMIQLAEWKSVSIVHHVPIPPEVKATLDSLSTSKSSSAASSLAARSSSSRPPIPALDRKNSAGGSPPTKSSIVPVRTATSSLAAKGRTGGSPKQSAASLSGSLSRSTGAALSTSSPPMDQFGSRRAPITDATDKSRSSSSRKQLDLDNSATPRRNSASRSSTSPSTPPSRTAPESRTVTGQSPERRRINPSAPVPSSASKSSASTRGERSPPAATTPRISKKEENTSSAASSAGSESRSSDFSDSTITSDGGFTDYLSDESEAELQRQAEAKAALVAQMQAEESEFKAARQQLAHVDLRPPKSWTPTNITNNTARIAGAKG